MAKKKIIGTGKSILIIVIIGILSFCIAFGAYVFVTTQQGDVVPTAGNELSIYFLQLGNHYTGDCIYIKAGDTDILVDGGSRADSVNTVTNFIDKHCTDGVLEYVIVTHADRDHIAIFAGDSKNQSIFAKYECATIIDFPKTNKNTKVYNKYVEEREKEKANGAKHHTALQCYQNEGEAKRSYELADGIKMTFLYHEFYENNTGDENDYSVCFIIEHGDKYFLFTGDLEKDGEASLVEHNTLPEVELFKAGHHGSYTSSSDKLLQMIKPKICCVCCCAGDDEYTNQLNSAHTFPAQEFCDRIAKYTSQVYVTTVISEDGSKALPMNGDVQVKSESGVVTVKCSNSDAVLKDTEWFKKNRTCPQEWK